MSSVAGSFPLSWREQRLAWLQLQGMAANPFALARDPAQEFAEWRELTIDVGLAYSTVSNMEGTWVVFGARGRGKTALRRVLEADCWPLLAGSKQLAVSLDREALVRFVAAAQHRLPVIDSLDFLAYWLICACEQVEAGCTAAEQRGEPVDVAGVRESSRQVVAACHAVRARGREQIKDVERLVLPGALLKQFQRMLTQGGYSSVLLLVDELSETAEAVAALGLEPLHFVTPIFAALTHLHQVWIKTVVLTPAEWKSRLEELHLFARDKIYAKELQWEATDLTEMLDRRLAFHTRSTTRIPSIEALCEQELRLSIRQELAALAEGRPRCALALAEGLLEQHCAGAPERRYIARALWLRVAAEWPARLRDVVHEEDRVGELWRSAALDGGAGGWGADAGGAAVAEPVAPELQIDAIFQRVYVGSRTVDLHEQEYLVLAYLYEQREQLCTKDAIAIGAWPDVKNREGVSDTALAQSISRLRKALGRAADGVEFIENKKGRGYILWPRGVQTRREPG